MATAIRPRDKGAKESFPEADPSWGLRWSYAGIDLARQTEPFFQSFRLYQFLRQLLISVLLELWKAQALSVALRALEKDDTELTASLCGLVLISPWLDLSCGSHTYEAWHNTEGRLLVSRKS